MGFLLPLNKVLKWDQEAWIRGLEKLNFVDEVHVQGGQVGFPLLPNAALKCGHIVRIAGLYKLKLPMESVMGAPKMPSLISIPGMCLMIAIMCNT